MPFKHNIASGGGEATYAPALSETVGMFIIANYGSSQGYDNDDGSNHDYSHHNFFYQADGFKMVRGARPLAAAPRRAAPRRVAPRARRAPRPFLRAYPPPRARALAGLRRPRQHLREQRRDRAALRRPELPEQ